MRRLVALATSCLLTAGCWSANTEGGVAGSSQSSAASSTASSPPTKSGNSAAGLDACELLSSDELGALAGGPVGSARPSLVGGLPACKWTTGDGRFVQVGSLTAPDWAQGLPELLRTLEHAGLVEDADDVRELKQVRELIESGQAMTPTEACAAFSKMLELQGQPSGTQLTVNVWPSNEDPQAMAGQMCSAGRFTTVTLANEEGLARPLPGEKVIKALRLAHRRSLG